MTEWLRLKGHPVTPKRVRRLMRQMGLEAVYPHRKRGLSIPNTQHKIYPYLLSDVTITRPSLVSRHYLYSDVSRLALFGSSYGLV